MSFYDSLHSDVVDIIYYSALAEGILEENLPISLFPKLFNQEEDRIIRMLRNNYVKDDQTSNIEKFAKIKFEGANREEISKTTIAINKLNDALILSDDEVKLAMERFKRKLIPQSCFSSNLKSILSSYPTTYSAIKRRK